MLTYDSIMTIQYLAIVVLFVNLLFVIKQNASKMQVYLVVLMVATILMFVGYIIEIRAKSLEGAEIGAATAYLGKPFIMAASLMFICEYYGFKMKSWLFSLISIYCAGFFVLVYTNDIHHLYYSVTDYDANLPFSPLITEHGKLYFTYVVTAVLFFITCIVLIAVGYFKNRTKENLKISITMSLMVVFGISGYATYLMKMIEGYDTTLLGVFAGSICLSVLFFRYKLFDALSYAKNEALKDSSVGLIVLNQSDSIIYSNQAGETLVNKISLKRFAYLKEGETVINHDDNVYLVKVKNLNMKNVNYGKSIEISDITISHNYQNRLEHDVKERTERIEEIQREVIGSFASIVEARSVETGEHIIRTKEYVELTARALVEKGMYTDILTDSYIALLGNAAPLHDIGKISVPDAILNKPGKLTPEEYEKMKIHAKEGAKIIEKTMRGVEDDNYVELACEVALYHHEKFDGTGYPKRLKGKNIPLSARIMAIADTYDALISERCYKKAFDKKTALNIIREESGSHFDPEIAETFIEVMS